MSHHIPIEIHGRKYGHFRITNDGIVLSIWINQPFGEGQLFIAENPIDIQKGD